MSYNGIGLSTARGSGTNGYVQKNIGNRSTVGHFERRKQQLEERERLYASSSRHRKITKDQELIDHETKREIELKCSVLRDELEENDELEDEQIDLKVDDLRKKLIEEQEERQRRQERRKRYAENKYESVNSRDLSPTRPESKSELEAKNFIDSFRPTGVDTDVDY